MELRSGIRVKRKMCETEADETTQTADITDIEIPDRTFSVFDWHYNQPFYVDKTLLMKALFAVHHTLITAPSRFGKSLNMDMIRRFVQIELDNEGKPIVLNVDKDKLCLKEDQPASENFKLFRGKKIFEDKEFMYQHFGKYPTINVDFSIVQGENFNQVMTALRRVVHTAFKEHAYLRKSDIWDRLRLNKKTFMKYYDSEEFKSLDEDETKHGLQILSEYLFGHFGTRAFVFIDEFDVPEHQFSEFYGFTKDEVVHLLKVANKSDHFEFVKSQFNGFLTKSRDRKDINIYSPYSIIKYISSDVYVDEWPDSIRSEIFKLSRMIKENDVDNEGISLFMQFLYEMAFFTPVSLVNGNLTLKMPNTT
ncbi:hypothetical protein PV325_011002, partial [Microctonus aethiopoides]